MAKKHKCFTFYTIIIFLTVSYICASWWSWWFGCSFGARNFVDYYPLLIIPFAFLLDKCLSHKIARIAVIAVISLCCYLNIDMEYYYDGCFYGTEWDFNTYLKLLQS